MKTLSLIIFLSLSLTSVDGYAKNDHHHNSKAKSIVSAVLNLLNPSKRPSAGQIITWNGHRWVPSKYARYKNPGHGSYSGEQFVWDGHHWVARPQQGGGNSVEITAGEGLLANGQTGGVITNEGILEVDVGTGPGQIPFINDDGDVAIQGFFVTGDGIVFADGSVQTTAAEGIQGPQGPQGPAGVDGVMGPMGPQGPAGVDGVMGPMGPQGPAGVAGAAGAVGPQGPAGIAGATGAQGPQGLKGDKGDTGAQGPAGVAGAIGPQGLKGDKGDTGAQGPAGVAGAAGAVGPQGPAGIAGATGAQGPQGLKGDKGDKGDTGAQGPAGVAGPIGPQGLQGLQGLQGPAGSDANVDVGTGPGQIVQVGLDGKIAASLLPDSAGGGSAAIAYVKDIKASGVHGGACTAGSWITRDLNTVEGDASVVSLSGNNFVLEPGKYEIDGIVPAFLSSQHKTRLVDTISGGTVLVGATGFSNNGAASMTQSVLKGTFTLTGQTIIRLEHRCGGSHTYGFGYASGFGENEVYSQIKIVKLN